VDPPLAARVVGGAGPPPSPPLCDVPTGAREGIDGRADLNGLRLGACDTIVWRTDWQDGHCRGASTPRRGTGRKLSTQEQNARCAPPCCRIRRDRSLAVKRPAHVWYVVSSGLCANRSRCRAAEPAQRHGAVMTPRRCSREMLASAAPCACRRGQQGTQRKLTAPSRTSAPIGGQSMSLPAIASRASQSLSALLSRLTASANLPLSAKSSTSIMPRLTT